MGGGMVADVCFLGSTPVGDAIYAGRVPQGFALFYACERRGWVADWVAEGVAVPNAQKAHTLTDARPCRSLRTRAIPAVQAQALQSSAPSSP